MWDFSSLQEEKRSSCWRNSDRTSGDLHEELQNQVALPAVRGYRIHLNDRLSEDIRTGGSVDRERGRQLQGSWTAGSNARRISLRIYLTVSCLFTLQTRHEASRLAPHRLSKEALLSSCHTAARNVLSSSWCRQRRCGASVRKSEMDRERRARRGSSFSAEPQTAAAARGKIKTFNSSLRFFQMADPSQCFLDTRGWRMICHCTH